MQRARAMLKTAIFAANLLAGAKLQIVAPPCDAGTILTLGPLFLSFPPTIEEFSYREWLRVGPDDATATGIRRKLDRQVLSPARSRRLPRDGEDKKSLTATHARRPLLTGRGL